MLRLFPPPTRLLKRRLRLHRRLVVQALSQHHKFAQLAACFRSHQESDYSENQDYHACSNYDANKSPK